MIRTYTILVLIVVFLLDKRQRLYDVVIREFDRTPCPGFFCSAKTKTAANLTFGLRGVAPSRKPAL